MGFKLSKQSGQSNSKKQSVGIVPFQLGGVSLFSGLSQANLNEILSYTKLKECNKGDVIFKIGDESQDLYIIESGKISLSGIDEHGDLKILATRETSEYFGEVNFKIEINQRPTQAAVLSSKAQIRGLNIEVLKKLEANEWFRPVMKKLLQRSASSISQTLRTIPFLSHIPDQKLRVLGELFSFDFLKPNDIVCKQGDPGDAFYIINTGKLSVTADTVNEKNHLIATLEAGSFFGEIALLEKIPRKANVTCAEEAICLKVTSNDFENFLICVPSVKKGLDAMVGLRTAERLKSSHIPFFEGLDNDKLHILAETCKVKEVQPNTVIIDQGDVGESFYFIVFGSVNVIVSDCDEAGNRIPDAPEKILSELKENQYFGELALISDIPRLATIKSIGRTILMEFGKEAFHSIFFSSVESIADFAIRLQQSEVSLDHVLNHTFACEKFKLYMEGEYCSESINFWNETIKFMKAKGSERSEVAQALCNRFISQKAPEQVNIPATMRVEIENKLQEHTDCPEVDLFDKARVEIFKLMERDNFRRFKKSKFFTDILDVVKPYQKSKVLAHASSSSNLSKTLNEAADRRTSSANVLNDLSQTHYEFQKSDMISKMSSSHPKKSSFAEEDETTVESS